VFKGVVDSPVEWAENERSVNIEILSEIEDQEIGVSLEETDIIDVDPDTNSPPWPLAFGNVVHVPATKVTQFPVAKLAEPFAAVDQMLYSQLRALEQAWYDQQVIITFWKLVEQGAMNIGATPSVLLYQYVYWIKLEYAYEQLVGENKEEIAEANNLRHIRRDKNDAERNKIDGVADLREEIKGFKSILKDIKGQKELVERMVDLAQYERDLRRAASMNITGAINGLMGIYQTYVAAMMEICRQSEHAILDIAVEDSEKFPQGTDLVLIINNLKWRGQFNDGVLTIHPEPMARYKDVPLGSRHSASDECGNIEEMKGADLFWISDASYNMTNMYLLVKNRNRNWRHIIKVIEQDGTKCRFQLMPFGSYNYQGQFGAKVVRTTTPVPTFNSRGWDKLPEGWSDMKPEINPWTQLSGVTMSALYPAMPNQDEIRNLRQLEKLTRYEGGGVTVVSIPSPRDIFTVIGQDIIEIEEVSPVPLPDWFDWPIYLEEYPDLIRWGGNVDDEVREDGTDHDIYVANILPSTVKAVYAYRTDKDKKIFTKVPTAYYSKNEAEVLYNADGDACLTITSIRLKVPLSHIQGELWEDQIYVTMDSSVGPNTVDIISYFVDTYTNKSKDAASFASVRAAIDNYPSSFALFNRPNVYEIINAIAMQARCVAYINNDIFYMKYLATEPGTDVTLTESDLSGEEPFKLSYGDASQLITKLVARWQPNYLPDKERYLTLRHNVNQYGLHEQEQDFFIYNIESLVIKSATFWLIRWANLWKRVAFTTFLPQLKLDLYDTVLFDLDQTHLASTAIKGVIEQVTYNSDNNSINFSCWLPVKIGEMTQYEFAWPAAAADDASFPTDVEVEQGNAGGSGIGRGIITIIQGQVDA